MTGDTIHALLKLPPGDRAELAMVLWESLDDSQREGEFQLTKELKAELQRRLDEHVASPESAIPWEEVRRQLFKK